jgi:hypothetical protein
MVPESTTAKIMAASGFLNSLKATLDEQSAEYCTTLPSPDITTSRKRKRADTPAVDSLSSMFSALRGVLAKLVEKANTLESHGDTVACNRLRAVLRMDAESASDLMSSWIRAVRILLSAHVSTAENLMYPMIDIWKLRSIPEADEFGTSSEEFSRNCLVQASWLYSTCARIKKNGAPEDTQRAVDACTLDIDHLHMRHLVGPARSWYFSATDRSRELKELKLKTLLHPIKAEVEHPKEIRHSEAAELLLQVVPSIFALAVEGYAESTFKQKFLAAPWVDAVFEYLAQFVGQPIAEGSFLERSALEDMLQIAIKRKVTISISVLRRTLSKYSGLSPADTISNSPGEVRWHLVTAMMELAPGIFTRDEIANPADITPRFRTDLVNRISGVLPHGSPPTDYMVEDVLGGLVAAFASVRNIEGFLKLWFDQLAKIRHEEFDSDGSWSLWATSGLLLLVSSYTRESSPPATLHLKFEWYGSIIDCLPAAISREAQIDAIENLPCWEKGFPALVLLEAILEACHGLPTLQHHSELLRTISSDLQYILPYAATFKSLERRLWRLLSKIHRLIVRFASVVNIQHNVNGVAHAVKRAYFPGRSTAVKISNEAFMCFLEICQSEEAASPMMENVLNGICAELVSNCEALLSNESDDVQLDPTDMVKLGLLVLYRTSLRWDASCRARSSC